MIRSLSVLSAGVVALAMVGAAKADNELVRLDGKGDAEMLEARYYGGGFRYGGFGGYRGFGYGGYRGVGFGYGGYRGFGYGYGGYRGFGYGGYRPYYGYYRPYGYGLRLGLGLGLGYGSYYGGGYYGGGYYGGGYYSSPVYYSQPYYSSYYYGCSTDAAGIPSTTLTIIRPSAPQAPFDGTFPYDGGPRDGSLAPNPAPAGVPGRLLPRGARLVSVPAPNSGYQFVAYGEQPIEPTTRPDAKSDTLRVSYPAYGEPMPDFVGGSTVYTSRSAD
jgi:hypothetical protein